MIREFSGELFGSKVFLINKNTLPKPFSDDGEIKMAILYKCFDLIVYPSYYESFGFVPLEAVSCGVPTLVRETDNLTTFVKENICEGFKDKKELCEKMKKMILNLEAYKEKAEERKQIIKEKYSLEEMKKSYEKLFSNIK
jgi:glycosyltransferase involved in cell wall biosynthesis